MGKTSTVTQQPAIPLLTLNFALICLSNLTLYMVFYGLNPTLPIYIEQFGGTTEIAGLALTSLTLAAIISRPVTGWCVDKYGRRLFLVIGLLLFLLPSLIFIWMIPVWWLILLRFVQGLGWGVGHTAVTNVALDVVPPQRMGEGMGYFTLFTSIAMALSPPIALWMISQYSFQSLFTVTALVIICTLIVTFFIRYPRVEKPPAGERPVFLEKSALLPSLVILLIMFSYTAVVSFLALYALDLGLQTAGYFFTASAITTMAARPLSGYIVDKTGRKGFNICFGIGTVAPIIALVILAFLSSTLHLVIAGLLYGVCLGFIYSTILIITVRRAPPERKGAANATYWTAVDVGMA
ncbi:MAG: MFS transporter, partial [Firmicutes bacterium]|nr:MFS transporter [Bacillota bacterium]